MNAHAIHQNHIVMLLIGAAFLLMSFVPATAQAASKPTCSVTVTTEAGKTKITKKRTVAVNEGEEYTIAWKSRNAKEATRGGDEIELSGSEEFTVSGTETYEFVFENGSRKATCEVTIEVATAEADDITTSDTKPTLTGEADGLKKVYVSVYNDDEKRVFGKKVSVKRSGDWRVKVTKRLSQGEYEIRLAATSRRSAEVLDEAKLTITDEDGEDEDNDENDSSKASKGILSVSTIPLLFGGTTRIGDDPSIIAIQLRNAGDEEVEVNGFTLKQRGTASTDAITGLSISDEKGGSRASSDGDFKDGQGFIATDATIAPGAIKIFTIKAALGSKAKAGTTLLFDIASIKTNGSAKGKLPLRGPTWTIGY